MVKAIYGGPAFKLSNLAGSFEDFDLHYVEYDSSVTRRKSSSTETTSYPGKDAGKTGAAGTTVYAKKYDKEEFVWVEKPSVYQIVNADSPVTRHKLRWFPVAIADTDLANQKTINSNYEAAVAAYDKQRIAYEAAIENAGKLSQTSLTEKLWYPSTYKQPAPVEIPVPPTQPVAYEGLYLKDSSQLTLKTGQFYIDHSNGGWGGFTMGLLKPSSALPEKSFGMFGSAKSCVKAADESTEDRQCTTQYATARAAADIGATYFNAQAQGYLSKTAEMEDTTSTDKFLIVSVWANAWDSTWSSTIKKDPANGTVIGKGRACEDATYQIGSKLTSQTLQACTNSCLAATDCKEIAFKSDGDCWLLKEGCAYVSNNDWRIQAVAENQFTIAFASEPWNKDMTNDWTAPAQPAAAQEPLIASATKISVTVGLVMVSATQFLY
mgnify:CR=1 FL=1